MAHDKPQHNHGLPPSATPATRSLQKERDAKRIQDERPELPGFERDDRTKNFPKRRKAK